ncbi:hypothetical protein QQ054_03840 [Oscillatoria amoena NRMC-F 0135]|uniref:Uncharacterized protein n=1 Tax=Geitlerinema calcuttense NRMC-F 0142 TaxID=2922238 RepID=A0ABT7LZW8_9CYAN|nr:hypothetical protein [Geitlerinema calcuttense]MCD8488461.1 hypothetical protein [Desertifilum sp.]MDL5045174.1 hypothetical protein [Oscillatoria amoena NRMC-F 0135]MDL5056341.1 hypothetical protein [Geitlerinema calcuttense NRMC-F 0142]
MTITPVKLTKPASLQTATDMPALLVPTPQVSANPQRSSSLTKSVYRAEQQAKFLNLQAEVDALLEQLQTIDRQRQSQLAAVNPVCQE